MNQQMNTLDKQYTDLLQTILDYGVEKKDRTGTGTKSIFGYTIRHNMKHGFPLLTTKKMAWKTMVTELLWFLRGDTNIKYLVDNNCHIWDGDCYQAYLKNFNSGNAIGEVVVDENGNDIRIPIPKDKFIEEIKLNSEFAKKWGELGPIYGKQWRGWRNGVGIETNLPHPDGGGDNIYEATNMYIDQIANLINDLKTNPDSRRLMVNAWNVGELDQMVLPPCHYGFQVYTRELSDEERLSWMKKNKSNVVLPMRDPNVTEFSMDEWFRPYGVPKRAISLMWNQRSCDVPLGIPMNIASYALLLTMIADEVNMVPDELIGNLGDCHIYLNQMDGVKEQIGRDLTLEERMDWWFDNHKPNRDVCDSVDELSPYAKGLYFDEARVPKRTREPYPLPKVSVRDGIHCSSVNDIILENYQSHPKIYFPLSN